MDAVDDAPEVDVDDLPPVLEGRPLERDRPPDACVVEEEIQSPGLCRRPLDPLLHLLLLRHVHDQRADAVPVRLELRRRGVDLLPTPPGQIDDRPAF